MKNNDKKSLLTFNPIFFHKFQFALSQKKSQKHLNKKQNKLAKTFT